MKLRISKENSKVDTRVVSVLSVKAYCRVEVYVYPFLPPALDGVIG
jgi:hypothetical protein